MSITLRKKLLRFSLAFIRSLHRSIDTGTEWIGCGVAWLVLAMVLLQFSVVILRYVFALGFIPLQESIWYLHGIVFMLGAAYTWLHNDHVRIDIFYRDASEKYKAMVDLIGVLVFLLPVCGVIGWFSWRYVASSWQVLEGSSEISGLPFIYLLKSVILVFVFLMMLQGISTALKALLILSNQTEAER